MAIENVKTEAAHFRRNNHLPAPAARAGSPAEVRGKTSGAVASRSWGEPVAVAVAANATTRTPQAVHPIHAPRRHCRRGANPQVRAAVSRPSSTAPRPAETPRTGGPRHLLLLHPAAPGRHLGTICTDTPLPTHRRHRGRGGGKRRPDVETPLRQHVRREVLHLLPFSKFNTQRSPYVKFLITE